MLLAHEHRAFGGGDELLKSTALAMFKTEFKKSKGRPSFDAPMAKADPMYGNVSLKNCRLGKKGSVKYPIKKYFKKFGSGAEITPKKKGGPLKYLDCDLSKKLVKKSGSIRCTVSFGQISGFVSKADYAVEKDGKKARKDRKKRLKNRSKKGRTKAKKRKKKRKGLFQKFFKKKAKGKKTKAKRSKKRKKKAKGKSKKKCKSKCAKRCKKKHKKGKSRKKCAKKCAKKCK